MMSWKIIRIIIASPAMHVTWKLLRRRGGGGGLEVEEGGEGGGGVDAPAVLDVGVGEAGAEASASLLEALQVGEAQVGVGLDLLRHLREGQRGGVDALAGDQPPGDAPAAVAVSARRHLERRAQAVPVAVRRTHPESQGRSEEEEGKLELMGSHFCSNSEFSFGGSMVMRFLGEKSIKVFFGCSIHFALWFVYYICLCVQCWSVCSS